MLGISEQDKLGHEEVHIEEKDAKVSFNINKCLHKIADGHCVAFVKVLASYGITPYNVDHFVL